MFLDTGFIIALEVLDDQNHKAALAYWTDLQVSLPSLTTSSYVFDEVVTFFNSRNLHAKAVEIGNRLKNSVSVDMIHVDEVLFQKGWQYFILRQDKSYSLTDCLSFVIMKQLRITKALAFDRHYVQAGFEKYP